MIKRIWPVFVATLLPLAAHGAASPEYPLRPVRMIAAQSAGSSLDTVIRIVSGRLGEVLGQQIVIDNRGGAGGTIGVELASRAAPDGHTLLAGASSSMIVARWTYRSLGFDALKDFDAISNVVNVDAVLVANPAVPVKTVKDLVALAKAQPGKLNMASAGVGSSSHLAGVMLSSLAGINTVHVPYKGGGPMAQAVIAGEAAYAISPAAAVVGFIKSGRVRGVAISSKQRSPLLPDLPTIDESGVPGYEYSSWNGLFAPRGTPRPIIDKLHQALEKATSDPAVRAGFAAQGLAPAPSRTPDEFAKFFREDFRRIEKIVQIAGVKPE